MATIPASQQAREAKGKSGPRETKEEEKGGRERMKEKGETRILLIVERKFYSILNDNLPQV